MIFHTVATPPAKCNQEIDDVFMSLYTDKAKGILIEQRFLRITETLEQEQTDNKTQLQTIMDELRIASSADSDVCQFIGEIRVYASIIKLDEVILNRLIDKIIVSAAEVIDDEKSSESSHYLQLYRRDFQLNIIE